MRKTSRSKTATSTKNRRFSFVSVKKGARRLSYWGAAVALLPLLWAVVHQTSLMVPALLEEGVASWWRYAAGAACYLVVERLIAKPMWLYVVGHEMTHVLSGFMSGAKVHSFKAKSSGGEVRLSKSNAFIALSPYVVPLYALTLTGVYLLTRHVWNPPQLRPLFEFLLGIAIAFHVSLTVSAIHKHQPDLKVLGHFLSGILILLGNVLILAMFGISLFSTTPRLTEFGRSVVADTVVGWRVAGAAAAKSATHVSRWIEGQTWTR
jgi:hypothetical protein